MDSVDLQKNRTEMDKLVLDAIRICIRDKQHDKVFGYLDLLQSTKRISFAVTLCNQLKENELANRVSEYKVKRERQEIIMSNRPVPLNNFSPYKSVTQPTNIKNQDLAQ